MILVLLTQSPIDYKIIIYTVTIMPSCKIEGMKAARESSDHVVRSILWIK